MLEEYKKEEWFVLYERAVLELEQAKMAGRIGDARTELAGRIEKLRDIPGLHEGEKQAIQDALNALRVLETEDERAKADERRIAEAALEKLRLIAPQLKKDG